MSGTNEEQGRNACDVRCGELAYLASHEGTGEMRDQGRAYLIERNKKMGKDEGGVRGGYRKHVSYCSRVL